MFKFLEDWKRRDDEAFTANWRSAFAVLYLRWIFVDGDLPTKDTISSEQLDKLNLSIGQNFLAYLYGAGMIWRTYSIARRNTSTPLKLMDETILGMSTVMHTSDNPGMILLNFVKVE